MTARGLVSKVTGRQITHVRPVFDPAPGTLTAGVYEQVERDLRVVIPPMLMHSPAPYVLAASWALMRETLHATGAAQRRDKEIVAAAVSVANTCPYCVDTHTTGLYDLASEHDAEALAADRLDDVLDPGARALARWGRLCHLVDEPVLRDPPFDAVQAAELIGVAVTFHYLTRMVNVFLPSYLLSPRLRGATRRRLKQGISRAMRPVLRQRAIPGEALGFLPPAPLPPDAGWASANPTLADAVARASAVFDDAGAETLSPAVRELVLTRLADWRGETMGISRTWSEDAIETLPAGEQAIGRLALLTAFASYQVDGDVVDAYRRERVNDEQLVKATAWVSYTTAAHIGARAARIAAHGATGSA